MVEDSQRTEDSHGTAHSRQVVAEQQAREVTDELRPERPSDLGQRLAQGALRGTDLGVLGTQGDDDREGRSHDDPLQVLVAEHLQRMDGAHLVWGSAAQTLGCLRRGQPPLTLFPPSV